MDIILVAGLWMGGWAWYEVAPALEREGHRPVPLTLPGMGSADADRSAITLADHVAAVVAAIDEAPGERVVLVGHSAGAGIVYAAADARPDRVARLILIGGFPTADGDPLLDGFATEGGELPLPPWSEFDDADLRDLGDGGKTAFRTYAIPSPAGVVTGIQRLGDDRRLDIPVTAIATEYTVADLQSWIDAGAPPVREFARLRDVTYVDLPTGHWPQLTRPHQLARIILAQPPLGDGTIAPELETISPVAFHSSEGVADWRVLYWGAHAFFRAESLSHGARLVAEVAAIAEGLDHYPDIDLRPEGVFVKTFSRRDGALSRTDADLAASVSRAARELGLEADPSVLTVVGIAVAQGPDAHVRPFWSAALGYDPLGGEDAIDPLRRNPHVWFHPLEPPKPGRGRTHIDISVPRDQVEARVAAALAVGGRMADDSHAPEWWTLTSPDNHGVDIAAWTDDSDFSG
ncbi:pimeloyl-ACP methyl ester carboxylesterase/pterin-4a-carbinolamine dehydratase [Microbacterium trichothecenolyticum]|uniref:alpha/beta fold hydrolase n=1 Tax=Microbacterium trichothecenolyticum TaxID=69370 RepID=UPI0028621163|nr:alpha/beta fold hydrolase [Microbacterium trichothecenolyticum]MDR7183226.1 pimeloyl-ACP methyl ester carboxylesterase/pterin-4a-carbinolamine dehydratase [Microbacterium trichothecenolyticum]